MESPLHCNDLKCRVVINDRAVVTTCSHIFCLPCAERLGLTSPHDGQRKCPACGAILVNPDDAVVTSLQPTEDYKTSILSGLSPVVIIDVAGRGLAFWSYQMAQEITYQEFLARSLTEKYTTLSTHLDHVVREANEETTKLHSKLETMTVDYQNLHEQHQNLDARLRAKDKKLRETETLYTKLKQQQLAAGVEQAAEYDAEAFTQGGGSQQPSQQPGGRNPFRRSRSNGSSGSAEQRRDRLTMDPSPACVGQGYDPRPSRGGIGSSHSAPVHTPQGSRQRLPDALPQPTFGHYNSTLMGPGARVGGGDGTYRSSQMCSYNAGGQTGAIDSPGGGVGLSANARFGRPMQMPSQVPGSRAGPLGGIGGRPSGYGGFVKR